ncbi:adenylyl-sulfate kinase [Caballeronia telluris]|uniref:Adenylyl-sulfate kinase n=1 Tax=Caballeronia telluris TaxID=326475 RepID=A0A158IZA2_9BURK|nr:adenylyl-sulfate kinase [Caballeronia telluris]SAL61381.1 adenylylsulfate kinase [Caballeronia telluris]
MNVVLKRASRVIWLTGLSGAGKSTIARALAASLTDSHVSCAVLDGDELRTGLNSDLSYSSQDRLENVRRVAHVAKLFLSHVDVVIVAVISPSRTGREMAKDVIGKGFLEIFVDAPIAICESRDPKGLYHKVRAGAISHFTGVSDPYEPPTSPVLSLRTDMLSLADEIGMLRALIDR